MKRSDITPRTREDIAFFTREDWQNEAADAAEIFDLQLGWDVTAFGGPDFLRTGLLLFTLRNGRAGDGRYRKPYAEKIMMVRENQVTPCHFHWKKCEDIINRGGGNLVVELYHADPARNRLVAGSFPISVNGLRRTMEPGEKLILTPGESVCLESIHAHRFYGEPGRGEVLVGEVSMVNDDENDNCFLDGVIRFDPVEEDEPPERIPAADYRKFVTEADHA